MGDDDIVTALNRSGSGDKRESYLMGLNSQDQTPRERAPMRATPRAIEYAGLFVESPPVQGEGRSEKPAIPVVTEYLKKMAKTEGEPFATYAGRLEAVAKGMEQIAAKNPKIPAETVIHGKEESEAIGVIGLLNAIDRAVRPLELPEKVQDALAAIRRKLTPDFQRSLQMSAESGSIVNGRK